MPVNIHATHVIVRSDLGSGIVPSTTIDTAARELLLPLRDLSSAFSSPTDLSAVFELTTATIGMVSGQTINIVKALLGEDQPNRDVYGAPLFRGMIPVLMYNRICKYFLKEIKTTVDKRRAITLPTALFTANVQEAAARFLALHCVEVLIQINIVAPFDHLYMIKRRGNALEGPIQLVATFGDCCEAVALRGIRKFDGKVTEDDKNGVNLSGRSVLGSAAAVILDRYLSRLRPFVRNAFTYVADFGRIVRYSAICAMGVQQTDGIRYDIWSQSINQFMRIMPFGLPVPQADENVPNAEDILGALDSGDGPVRRIPLSSFPSYFSLVHYTNAKADHVATVLLPAIPAAGATPVAIVEQNSADFTNVQEADWTGDMTTPTETALNGVQDVVAAITEHLPNDGASDMILSAIASPDLAVYVFARCQSQAILISGTVTTGSVSFPGIEKLLCEVKVSKNTSTGAGKARSSLQGVPGKGESFKKDESALTLSMTIAIEPYQNAENFGRTSTDGTTAIVTNAFDAIRLLPPLAATQALPLLPGVMSSLPAGQRITVFAPESSFVRSPLATSVTMTLKSCTYGVLGREAVAVESLSYTGWLSELLGSSIIGASYTQPASIEWRTGITLSLFHLLRAYTYDPDAAAVAPLTRWVTLIGDVSPSLNKKSVAESCSHAAVQFVFAMSDSLLPLVNAAAEVRIATLQSDLEVNATLDNRVEIAMQMLETLLIKHKPSEADASKLDPTFSISEFTKSEVFRAIARAAIRQRAPKVPESLRSNRPVLTV
jgi:hypothetical protein